MATNHHRPHDYDHDYRSSNVVAVDALETQRWWPPSCFACYAPRPFENIHCKYFAISPDSNNHLVPFASIKSHNNDFDCCYYCYYYFELDNSLNSRFFADFAHLIVAFFAPRKSVLLLVLLSVVRLRMVTIGFSSGLRGEIGHE